MYVCIPLDYVVFLLTSKTGQVHKINHPTHLNIYTFWLPVSPEFVNETMGIQKVDLEKPNELLTPWRPNTQQKRRVKDTKTQLKEETQRIHGTIVYLRTWMVDVYGKGR